VQALRLCRVVVAERAAAPLRALLLQPFLEPQVCREIVALYPQGRTESECELQSALTALAVFVLEGAPDCAHFAQVADGLIGGGLFRAGLQATRGAMSDVCCIARLLASCQNYSQGDLYDCIDTDCIVSACIAMLTNHSSSCCSVGMVRMPRVLLSLAHDSILISLIMSQVILANSLRDGALTAEQLLQPPALVAAVLGCDDMFLAGGLGAESAGNADGVVAAWYVVAAMCSAADAALRASESLDHPPPAFVGALAMHLALSQSFLSAASASTSALQPPLQLYIQVAAAAALKLTAAAACSATASRALDHTHPWACGSEYLEAALSCTGCSAAQLLSRARDALRGGER